MLALLLDLIRVPDSVAAIAKEEGVEQSKHAIHSFAPIVLAVHLVENIVCGVISVRPLDSTLGLTILAMVSAH